MTTEDDADRVIRRLARERRARVEAEAIAERTTRALYDASALVTLLQRAAVAANQASELEDAATTVLHEVCRYTHWPVGHLYVVTGPDELEPSRVWYLEDEERYREFRDVTERTPLAAGVGLPGRVFASGRPAWIRDVTEDANFPRARHAIDIGVRAAFGFPVLAGEEVVAVLEFFSESAAEPDEDLLELMGNVGTQLGRVVERKRAQQALRNSEEQIRLVIDTAHDAFVATDAGSRIIEWNRQAEQIFGWTREEAIGRDLAETVIPPQHRAAHAAGVDRFLSSGHGPVLGRRLELTALHRDGDEFAIELTPWAVHIGDDLRFNAFIHDISERKAFERRLEDQALHDCLTGLPNRTLLLDRLRHALTRRARDGLVTAVLFLDLDRFKAVNDSLGHESGDRLLLAVAERLTSALRPGDTLARLGGDEFVVLCDHLSTTEATLVAERILASFRSPFVLNAGEVSVSASVGVAVAAVADADAERLLGDADMAMYRAKERGRGVYDLYDEGMRARLSERVALEGALRTGIDGGELVVLYQPTVNLLELAITGAEALVRWQHPTRGLLEPDEFIPLAEETGLILPLGEFVLGEACRQAAVWNCAGNGARDLCISVNVSVRELEAAGCVDRVAAALAQSGLAPGSLALEVTESALMRDISTIVDRLAELRVLGVGVAIDDFGTGYSSLDRLLRLPVETLKIDMSFVAELDTTVGAEPLVTAMIAMAHSLGVVVVAEGVETVAQLRMLRRLGCDFAQGYLLGRPVGASALEGLLVNPPPFHRMLASRPSGVIRSA